MTTIERLAAWRTSGILADSAHDRLAAIVRGDRLSVALELNAVLYAGVLAIASGVAWTIDARFEQLGDAAILLALTSALAAAAWYCWSRAPAFAPAEVESPGLVFDYALYLGAVILGIELGYIETRFGVLGERWDLHVLVAALAYFAGAYRFDNRFLLSLGLSTLAAWFGITLTLWGYGDPARLRVSALAYGLLVAALGWSGRRASVKAHFLETYLHVAAIVLFTALVSGVGEPLGPAYLAAVLGLGAVSILGGISHRRFLFVAYGVVYAYLAISYQVARLEPGLLLMLVYTILSGSAVLVLLAALARRVGRPT